MGQNTAEYEIRLKDNFSRTLDRMESRLNRFERRMKEVNSEAGGFGRNNGGFGRGGGFGGGSRGGGGGGAMGMFKGMLAYNAYSMLISGAVNAGKALVRLGGELEQTRISFGAMLGSQKAGDSAITSMRSFAVATPFSQNEVLASSKQMLAYGFGMGEMTKQMRMLGDVSAGLNIRLDDMVFVYGTLKAQGRAFARDLYQFAHRGIPIYDALAKTMNKTKVEIKEMTTDGAIGFKEIEKAFEYMTKAGSMFGGLMEKQSHSLFGRWEKFTDTMKVWWADLGESEVNPVLGKLLDDFASLFKKVGNPMDIAREESKVFNERIKGERELFEEYKKLSTTKGGLSAEEQDRYVRVLDEMVRIVGVEGVTAWNSSNQAQAISLEYAERHFALQEKMQRNKERDAIWENRGRINQLNEEIDKNRELLRVAIAKEAVLGAPQRRNFWQSPVTELWYMNFGDESAESLNAKILSATNALAELELTWLDYTKSEEDFKKELESNPNFKRADFERQAWERFRAYKKSVATGVGTGLASGGLNGDMSGLERIQAQTRNIYVTIGNVIEGGIKFMSYESNEQELITRVSRALVSAINDVNSLEPTQDA